MICGNSHKAPAYTLGSNNGSLPAMGKVFMSFSYMGSWCYVFN